MVIRKNIMKIISLLLALALVSMSFLPNTTYASTKKSTEEMPNVEYRVHVQGNGWLNYVSNGKIAGTMGKSKRMEAIQIKVTGNKNLGIKYMTHLQNYGWGKWSENGKMSGTTGQSRRLEAISIKLTGKDAYKYNVYYCVHVQNYGWLNWVSNGVETGTTGLGLRAEAIKIKIVKKGQGAPKDLAINPYFIDQNYEYYDTEPEESEWYDPEPNESVWAECE